MTSPSVTSSLQIPPDLSKIIEKLLKPHHLKLRNARKIAACVQKLSDYYISYPDEATPWSKEFTQVAYAAYYLPLNFIRNLEIFHEVQRLGFAKNAEHLIDFGSGTGAGSLPYLINSSCQKWRSLHFIEQSEKAIEQHRFLLSHWPLKLSQKWSQDHESQQITHPQKTMGLFSYSLTELPELPQWINTVEHLVLVEPSTRQDGRRLMQWRSNLQERGFHIWSPCTHQNHCPLLNQSKKDWCHHRVHWQAPEWFQEISKFLNIKNRTLTLSYLLASKEPPPLTTKTRLVGDPLKEKGKTRQMICRGPEREFLTWLKKNKNTQELQRGELIELPSCLEKKGNELRVL